MAREVHIIINGGLVQEVYCDNDTKVYVYDLDAQDAEGYDILEEEIEKLEQKYKKCSEEFSYVYPEDLKED